MCVCVRAQVLQEEMGVVKSYNLKPGGDKIPVTKQNRKGEYQLPVCMSQNMTDWWTIDEQLTPKRWLA